jgi:antitoxin component YwqK of YwqJK toxin-antitoxin module
MKSKLLTSILSLTFLFLFSGSVFGEEPEVKREYYDSGKLKSEAHYKNGKKDGLEILWYKSGKKSIETHYKNGKLEGYFIEWDPSGKEVSVKHYKNGLENESGDDNNGGVWNTLKY